MKMAEKPIMLTFQNNCESINSNCVEVDDQLAGKITNGDITIEESTSINKPEDEPTTMLETSILDDINNVTQEGADFLAGEANDDLLLETIENDNDDDICFKTENVIVDCGEIEEKDEYSEECDEGEQEGIDDEEVEDDKVTSMENFIEEDVDNAECLTKMQIMEDVREGGSVQPSSPGHAEERSTIDDQTKSEDPEGNGFEEENCLNSEEESKEMETIKEQDKSNEKLIIEDNIKSENSGSNDQIPEDNSNTNSSEESQTNNKRKAENVDTATKRLRLEIQENFFTRDKILSEFIELSDCNTIDQLQNQTGQILTEIRILNDMAREKEREWNNIIHLKKMKEELLLRMQRRKQVLLLQTDKNDNGDVVIMNESQNDVLKNNNTQNQSILKANLSNPRKFTTEKGGIKHKNNLSKPSQYSLEMNGDYKQNNKQRPVLDVQSIIADYRQRHPETVPRRGRRIRNAQNDKTSSNIINFTSLALGAGSQVHHNIGGNYDSNNELGILLNAMDSNRVETSRPSSAESSQNSEPSFKDMLVQFAKLSQSERNELIQNAIKPPPPYPEVTVHAVPTTTVTPPTNSLLHGILTKSTTTKTNTKTSFSPTLARLLTAPERGNNPTPNITNNLMHSANMSISEILSTSKARNEITITPVGAQYENPQIKKAAAEEDEAEDSADRLVIDESGEAVDRSRGDNSSDGGDEVPQCQGCNQKSALFVCAGCGNQWYCSRECQVSAWDEHSEVCSG